MSDNFINAQYPNQAVTLVEPTGRVVGYHRDGSRNQQWEVVVVGGNRITIQSSATGTFASVPSESQGAPAIVNPEPYTWELLSVPGGWYQIATPDGKFVWRLTSGKDYAPIVLQATPYQGKDAQWGFDPAVQLK